MSTSRVATSSRLSALSNEQFDQKVLRVKNELQTFVSFRIAELEHVRPSQDVIDLINTCIGRVNLILDENERRLASGPAGQAYVRTRDLEVEYSLDAICVLLAKLKAAKARFQGGIEVAERTASTTSDEDLPIIGTDETKDQEKCRLSDYSNGLSSTEVLHSSPKRQKIGEKASSAPSVQHDLISPNLAYAEMQALPPKKRSRQSSDEPDPDQQPVQATQNTQGGVSDKWMLRYNELAQHKKNYGHCKVSKKHSTLLTWVYLQRKRRKDPTRYKAMSAEEIRLLNELGFEWESRPRKKREAQAPAPSQERAIPKKWLISYNELVQYKEKYGDCDIPYNSKDHMVLRRWLGRQKLRKKGKSRSPPLIPQEIQLLEDLGVNWDGWGTSKKKKEWNKWFDELVRYKEKYGTCNVSRNSNDYQALGGWVKKQRLRYRGERGGTTTMRPLSEEEIGRLEDIEFEFEGASVRQSRREEQWNKRYEELVEFKKKYGHCNVPNSKNLTNPRKRKMKSKEFDALACWVSTQRTRYCHGNLQSRIKPLSEEEIRLLEELGFEWNRANSRRGGRKGRR